MRPIGAAQGIFWLGRHALHRSLRSDGAARCKAQPPMPLFRHCLGSSASTPHHEAVGVAESPQLLRNSARKIGK
jgi:hypothetical protein